MLEYTPGNARDWARSHLRGVANVIIPSYRNDLEGMNEAAVRHDVRRNIEFGFAGALIVGDVALTLDEYTETLGWAHDEAGGRHLLIHHATFGTLRQNIDAARRAERSGAQLALLTYPPSFYPRSEQDVFDYTRAFCDATRLAVMLFPVPLWGFGRLHPADLSVPLLRKLLDVCPNIVAIKAEGGYPSKMGYIEVHRHFHRDVVLSCPVEADMVALGQILPIEFSATSNAEYLGPVVPQMFDLLQRRDFDAATALYWRVHPARKSNQLASAATVGMGLINRMLWKYQAWLQGYNGGPLRQPAMRVSDEFMSRLRQGLLKSGLEPTPLQDHEFFTGRHPA